PDQDESAHRDSDDERGDEWRIAMEPEAEADDEIVEAEPASQHRHPRPPRRTRADLLVIPVVAKGLDQRPDPDDRDHRSTDRSCPFRDAAGGCPADPDPDERDREFEDSEDQRGPNVSTPPAHRAE